MAEEQQQLLLLYVDLLRGVEAWQRLQESSQQPLQRALNLLIEQQYLQGDYLITLQVYPEIRERCLRGHARRIGLAQKELADTFTQLENTHARIKEVAEAFELRRTARLRCAATTAAEATAAEAAEAEAAAAEAAAVPESRKGKKKKKGKRSSAGPAAAFPVSSSSSASPAAPPAVAAKTAAAAATAAATAADHYEEEVGRLAVEVEEAYGRQLQLQRRLLDLLRSGRLSPFDRRELQRVATLWVDRPCEWPLARDRRLTAMMDVLKKKLGRLR